LGARTELMTELFGLGLFGLGLGLFGSVFGLRLIMPRVMHDCWAILMMN
jgi:hypothetical protein